MTIDKNEGYDVATIDTPNEFIHTYIGDEFINITIRGRLVDLMYKIDPAVYCKQIKFDVKRTIAINLQMLKDNYGTMKYGLIFYLNLVKEIKLRVLQLNHYDLCVTNKPIEGYQVNLV